MRTVTFDARPCKGKVVPFTQNKPNEWLVLTVPDGTEIRVKYEVSEIVQVVGEFYDNGEPAYLVSWAMQQVVNAPEGHHKEDVKGKVQ